MTLAEPAALTGSVGHTGFVSDVQPETDTSTLGDARQLSRCPCLSGSAYQDCCGPYHSGSADAPTAERLMRSRYSAFVLGDAE